MPTPSQTTYGERGSKAATARRRRLFVVVGAFAALAASVLTTSGAAVGPPRDDKPIKVICANQGGTYWGPNAVLHIDTQGMTNAGYFCYFPGPRAGDSEGPQVAPAEVLEAPSLRRIEALCSAANGTFYTDVRIIGPIYPDDVYYFVWGCEWLT